MSDNLNVRAFIVQAFDPRFFYVCPECKKKASQEENGFTCAEHGRVIAEKRALINLVLDDGTETMRAVLFHEALLKLGLTEFENSSLLSQQKENLLGKEMNFSGTIRLNKFFNNPEFIIENLADVELDKLIGKLESR